MTLRLENASASEEKDKKMIDELIQKARWEGFFKSFAGFGFRVKGLGLSHMP